MVSLAELGTPLGNKVGIPSSSGALQEVQVVKIQNPVRMVDTYQNGAVHEYVIPGWIYVTPPLNEIERYVIYYPETQTFRVFGTRGEYDARKHYRGELLVEELPFNFQGFQPLNSS